MTRWTPRLATAAALIMFGPLLSGTSVSAGQATQPPQPSSAEDVLPALLQEVQLLREVQSELGSVTAVRVDLARRLANLEEARRGNGGPERQREIDGALEGVKQRIETEGARAQRLRAEETDALQRLRSAESRARELNDRLDQIERQLSNPRRSR